MKQQKFKRHRFFHFTTQFVHPKWFQTSPLENWLNFVNSLSQVQILRREEEFVWHAGVLMSNHLHLLFSTQCYNEHSLVLELESVMMSKLNIQKTLFQRPLPCEPLEHLEHLRAAYKYIYRNPVEAGLTHKPELYPYSSLYLLLNKETPSIAHPFIDPLQLIQNLPQRLRWLNSQTHFGASSFDFWQDQGLGF